MEQETQQKKEQTPEDATTVGMLLKYTRLSQKKTIDAVAKALCIRKIYIRAIEESDFQELPPIPYGVGFVRSYAEFLGLNSDRIAQCYKEEALPKKQEEAATPVVEKHTPLTIPNRRQILMGIAAVLCIYLIWSLVSCKPENETPQKALPSIEQEENIPAPQENPAKETEAALEVSSESMDIPENSQIKMVEDSYFDEKNATKQPKPDSQSRIVVKFNGDSWFEIRDGKKVYISGIFKKGYIYNVPDVSGLLFSVGRYYNVDVYIDGQLTQIARPRRQTNIALDKFLNH